MSRKSIHVKLTKESHAALREKLFRYGITMQDLFQEAANSVLSDDDRAERILQKIAKKKMLTEIEKLENKNRLQLGDFDSETMYNLLELDARKNEE